MLTPNFTTSSVLASLQAINSSIAGSYLSFTWSFA